jgi:hypothetical protein
MLSNPASLPAQPDTSIGSEHGFSSQDTPASQPVVVVNEAWAKEFLTQKQDPSCRLSLKIADALIEKRIAL